MIDHPGFGLWQRRLSAVTIACVLATIAFPTGALAAPSTDDDAAIDPLQGANVKVVAQASAPTHKVFHGSQQDIDAITIPPPNLAPKAPTPAFAIKDPQTGATVSPDAQIVVPSGKKVRAGDYWDLMNKTEKLLNKRGQSLKDKNANGQPQKHFDLGRFKGSTDAELQASRTHSKQVGPATLAANGLGSTSEALALLPATVRTKLIPDDVPDMTVATLAPKATPTAHASPHASAGPVFQTPTPTSTPTLPPVADEQYGYKSMKRAPLDPLPPEVDTVQLSNFADTKNYVDSSGNPSLAQFFLATTVNVQALGTVPMISEQLAFGVTFINDREDLGTVSATINSSKANFAVTVLGDTVYSLSPGLPISGHPEDVIPFFSFDIPFQLTICVVDISASMTGSIGVAYSIGPAQPKSGGTALSASFIPDLSINSTFSATIGIGIADIVSLNIGVSGNLTVVVLHLHVAGSAQFDMVSSRHGTDQSSLRSIDGCQAQFKYGLSVDLHYQFLSGNLNLVATACFIFCDTVLSQQIAKWSGIGPDSASILKMGGAVPFGGVYTDLPEYGYALPSNSTYSKDDSSGAPAACTNLAKQLNLNLAQT